MGKKKEKGGADRSTEKCRRRTDESIRNSQTDKGSSSPIQEVSRTVRPPRKNDDDNRNA